MIILVNVIEELDTEIQYWGRNPDGTLYHKVDKSFRPYFYVPSEKETEYKSIFGKFVKRIYVEHPKDVVFKRSKFSESFEGDITYVNRYLVDKFPKLEKEPLRICYLDIENLPLEGGEFSGPEEAATPITAIGCYDNFLKKYVIFYWHPKEIVKEKSETLSIYHSHTEVGMLKNFIDFIKTTDPDMLVAWNGDGFDYPYIINRLTKLGMHPEELSRMGDVRTKPKAKIRGRILFDLMYAYSKMMAGEKDTKKLSGIAQIELGLNKIEHEEDFETFWKDHTKKFLLYNQRDVELLKRLDEELGISDFFNEIRLISKSTFDDVYSKTRILDFFMMDFLKPKKLVIPTKPKQDRLEKIKGGAVIEPEPGLYEYVSCCDFKSLYPSLIISFNMSPETLGGEMKLENGVSFTNKRGKGIIPQLLEELFKLRQEWKKEMVKHVRGTQKYKEFYSKQYALKVLMNSFYGALASPIFRLYRREIGDSITFMGRKAIEYTKNKIEELGGKVIYGDTDSSFFTIADAKDTDQLVELSKELIAKVNESYSVFTEQYKMKSNILNLQFEKVFETLIFAKKSSGKGAKKRYAGRLRWLDGKEIDDLIIVGFEAIRSDSARFSRKFQKKILEMILMDRKSKDEVFDFVRSKVKELQEGSVSMKDLAIPKTIVGDPYSSDDYKKLPIHIRAAKLANRYNKEKFRKGSKIKLVYVSKTPIGIPFENIIGFSDKFPKGYEVDYKKMIEKTIYDKLKTIFKSLDWDIEELKGQGKLSRWFIESKTK